MRWPTGKSSRPRILIVDDEPFNIVGLKIILKKAAGNTQLVDLIDSAKSGLEAIDLVKQASWRGHMYSLIFMDCSMPVMDGYEATEKIREHYSIQNQG